MSFYADSSIPHEYQLLQTEICQLQEYKQPREFKNVTFSAMYMIRIGPCKQKSKQRSSVIQLKKNKTAFKDQKQEM